MCINSKVVILRNMDIYIYCRSCQKKFHIWLGLMANKFIIGRNYKCYWTLLQYRDESKYNRNIDNRTFNLIFHNSYLVRGNCEAWLNKR